MISFCCAQNLCQKIAFVPRFGLDRRQGPVYYSSSEGNETPSMTRDEGKDAKVTCVFSSFSSMIRLLLLGYDFPVMPISRSTIRETNRQIVRLLKLVG